MKVKFCGLTGPEDISVANELKPDYVGFVFAGKKRRVTDEQAAALRSLLCHHIPAVGVFAAEPVEHILQLVISGTIQVVQLHGREDKTYIKKLRTQCDVLLIKAFSVADAADIEAAEQADADLILLDNGAGGTGRAFPWHLLQLIKRPYILAGGLNLCNVKKAMAYAPYALDVSSGIESNGRKDAAKMREFMRLVRSQ